MPKGGGLSGRLRRSRQCLRQGLAEGVFPGAVLLVAEGGETVLLESCGAVSSDAGAAEVTPRTIFDLASLTKPLATTLAIMKLVDEGRVGLDQPLAGILGKTMPGGMACLTPRLLLCHAAGLRDWHPFYLELRGVAPSERKGAVRRAILDMPPVHRPGEACLYSDLGFMLLEWVVEVSAGLPLDRYVARSFYQPLGLTRLFFGRGGPGEARLEEFAATERCPWRGRVIHGEVHDDNAYFMGGFSGHAGLFGCALEVHGVLQMLLGHLKGEQDRFLKPETVREFLTRQDIVSGSTWALGWDTPSLTGSSAGRFFPPCSVGHLGFTGTSVWVDLTRGIEVILLTNRVHPTRENIKIRAFRPRLHDTVMEELLG